MVLKVMATVTAVQVQYIVCNVMWSGLVGLIGADEHAAVTSQKSSSSGGGGGKKKMKWEKERKRKKKKEGEE